jgi:hypothetical protein
VSLAAYGGFKWSLFYQPGRRIWSIVFNTAPALGVAPACPPRPLWGAPVIVVTR